MTDRQDKLQYAETFQLIMKQIFTNWHKNNTTGLNQTQARILHKLDSLGPQKASVLAEALCITSGAITGVSDKLVTEGYAKRYRDERDRRVVYLEITDKGKEMIELLREYQIKSIGIMFEDLTDEELEHTYRIFRKILSNLERHDK